MYKILSFIDRFKSDSTTKLIIIINFFKLQKEFCKFNFNFLNVLFIVTWWMAAIWYWKEEGVAAYKSGPI